MNDIKYWKRFYKTHKKDKPSSFAKFCLPFLKGEVTELGSGNGRDANFFKSKGLSVYAIDEAIGISAEEWIRYNESDDYIYTRFFWHAIDRKVQLDILKWTKRFLFIEARTTEDRKTKKVFKNHNRNYVDVAQLVKDLKDNNFEIEYLKEGRGLAPYKKEDPHIIRVIARKR